VLIVSNTSPISNLAKVGQLSLIEALYGRILIPRAVYEELLDERAGETVIAAVKSSIWIEVRFAQNQLLVDELRTRINIGEAEAITLADEVKATRLLIDERLGRQAAKDLGLKVTGVLGILLAAKKEALITSVKPIMDNLVNQANFRISRQLYDEILDVANE
jgi:predicted nucleic acid-binding protein